MKPIVMGIYDAPQRQMQPKLEVDLLRSNIIVFGSTQSGKTTFCKTLLRHLQEAVQPEQAAEEIYIIDFGGNLASYEALPAVAACVDNSNEENIKRVFKTIEKRLEKNAKFLKHKGFAAVYESDKPLQEKPKHITLLMENVGAFLAEENYSAYHEILMKFCRDGLSKGLTVILTANDTGAGLMRYLTSFGYKFAFDMPTDKYMDIFSAKVMHPIQTPGRGLALIAPEVLEFQCLLPFADEDAQFAQWVQAMEAKYVNCPKPEKLKPFSEILDAKNFAEYAADGSTLESCQEKYDIVVGLDYYEHKPVAINLTDTHTIAIYGKRKFGKTNLLHVIMKELMAEHADSRFIFFDDGRKELQPFHEALPQGDNNVYITNYPDFDLYLEKNDYTTTADAKKAAAATEKPAAAPTESPMPAMPPMFSPFGGAPVGGPPPVLPSFGNPVPLAGMPSFEPEPVVQPPTPEPEPEPVPETKKSLTVFVLQSKLLYQKTALKFIEVTLPYLAANADERGYLFLFTDVRKITEFTMAAAFNNCISMAFLLDNLSEFIVDKGQRSVFGEMDPKEMKSEYARCEIGDGFCYDIESDELKKLKFIKTETPDDGQEA